VDHHAGDRIETVLYRLCRGAGLSGLEGIGWSSPLEISGAPELTGWLEWTPQTGPAAFDAGAVRPGALTIVRPLLACSREEILGYLRSLRQKFRADATNLDTRIPRNALRRLVLPLLERKVHPGVRAALWRLSEDAAVHTARSAWRRGWLSAVAAMSARGCLALPAAPGGALPSTGELADILALLRGYWRLRAAEWSAKHLQAVRLLFGPSGATRRLELPGGLRAARAGREVLFRPRTQGWN
jgi:tRNA(Ile)-lysidine synthase